uniref:CID domain-containing protein n=1 Tax=Mucochytrium quahogii TaxID=96639 RepID=A0A7S2RQA0_9STRA|mmetsp:Transcript_11239/g.17921  ORF Transcript_11239/g.17921 Transcript_11239/m.17921 type:complete len:523 (+) Transcript_11239:52-1620(+)
MGDFLGDYERRLKGMGSHPDKNKINHLTKLAGDVSQGAVPNVRVTDIVGCVGHCLLRAPPEAKLTIIYLMDSIMFNVRGDYPRLLAEQMPHYFRDAYRTGTETSRAALRKLLKAWAARKPREGPMPPKVIAAINKQVDPSFDTDGFMRDMMRRNPSPIPSQSASTSYPSNSSQMHNRGPGAPNTYDRGPGGAQLSSGYMQPAQGNELHKHAVIILDGIQAELNIPPAQRVQINELYMKPDLEREVYDTARKALERERAGSMPPPAAPATAYPPAQLNVHVPPSYGGGFQIGTPPGHSPVMAGRNIESWSPDVLRDSRGAVSIASRLYHSCIPPPQRGPFLDNIGNSGLSFATEENMEKYLEDKRIVLANIRTERARFGPGKQMSRNWFLPASAWKKSQKHPLFVDGSGFNSDQAVNEKEDDNTVNPQAAMSRQDSLSSTMSENALGVPVDNNYTSCALTGQDFTTVFDDDSGEWVYKGTVRPDPNGPIYMASAYFAQQAQSNDGKRPIDSNELLSPIKKQKT